MGKLFASYLSMGKFTFAWSTDTDALAHGQIHFCAQTFFVWSIIITLNAHAKMKTLIKVAVYRLGVAAVVSKTARYPARRQN